MINYMQYSYSLWDDAGYWLLFALILFQAFVILVMARTLDRTIRMTRQHARFLDSLSELDRARGREMHTLRQIIGLRDVSDNGHAANNSTGIRPTIIDKRSVE
jgi:phosphoglycerate-specific signal transduction histidine kinase